MKKADNSNKRVVRDISWKIPISDKIGVLEKTYLVAINDYIRTGKRIDRDRCIQIKAKIDVCYELIQT